ncbi:hypothetical protein DZJ_29470 [Dickeya ananatis]
MCKLYVLTHCLKRWRCWWLKVSSKGFGFLCRLQTEFQSGANNFRLPGEGLFAVFEAERLVAIGGVNQQAGMPYTGRLRRFLCCFGLSSAGCGA